MGCVCSCVTNIVLRKQGSQGYLKVADPVQVLFHSSTFHVCQVRCVWPWLFVEIIYLPALLDKCCLVSPSLSLTYSQTKPHYSQIRASVHYRVILWADNLEVESANSFALQTPGLYLCVCVYFCGFVCNPWQAQHMPVKCFWQDVDVKSVNEQCGKIDD